MIIASRQRRAFTLIEMLLAAAAAALILAVLVTVYTRAIKLRNQSVDHTRASLLEARAIRVLRQDLRGARLSGGSLAQTLDTGSGTVSSRFPGGLRFDTTSGAVSEDVFQSELLEVEYRIAEDPNSPDQKSGTLTRSVSHSLPNATPEIEREEALLTGVEAMEIGFFDGSEWQATYTIDTEDITPPLALRIRLTMSPEARPGSTRRTIEVLVPWSTQVAIPAATTSTSTSGSGTSTGTGGTN